MSTSSDQGNSENVQPDRASNGHDTKVWRAQLSHLVHAATRSTGQLQRDGEWDSYVAGRLAEVSYALHRATVALTEIDRVERQP